MRTFEELKKMIETSQVEMMQVIEKGKLYNVYNDGYCKRVIQECKAYLDNLDEVTTIEIGASTNEIIDAIKSAYQFDSVAYWQDFEKFISDYIVGLTPDGNLTRGLYLGYCPCHKLGVGVNELLCLKDQSPIFYNFGDSFRKMINDHYGTNIPMAGIEQQALYDFESARLSDGSEYDIEAFVRLKELQRDSGSLKIGGSYYILATDQMYQDVKAKCRGKKL